MLLVELSFAEPKRLDKADKPRTYLISTENTTILADNRLS